MKTEIKIIGALLEKGNKKYTIRDLSREIKSDYKITHTAVKKLVRKNLVNEKRIGRALNISLIKKPSWEIIRVEYKRREKVMKNKDFKIIQERLSSLPFQLIVLVFGSYVNGRSTKNSDIDLMIICEKSRQSELEEIISLLPLDIHLNIFTYEEFLEMAKSKEFSVVSEAMEKNIILVGIEDYYRLIKNVG